MVFTLIPAQRDEFERRGVVRLPGFYDRADIDAMAGRVWADLERRFGVRRDRPETWAGAAPGKFQALRSSGAFDALRSPKLCELADALLGGIWAEPEHWGMLLITLPMPAPPQARPPWHLDIDGAERLNPLPILRIFTFLEAVRPRGGGTLYVAGSHLLAMAIERAHGAPVRSAQIRDRLKSEQPWFADLLAARYEELRGIIDVEARVGGHAIRLEEMIGAPGDLIIMHPAILHGTAHNALDRPRMMVTEWIMRGRRQPG
jgi:Phytanoyl-CoA dioxygenase (PhyH)